MKGKNSEILSETQAMKYLCLALSTALLAGCAAPAEKAAPPAVQHDARTEDALAAALNSPLRTAESRARDVYRHPQQTLQFFGISPTQTVIEISPAGGWYSEILAPYLRAGRYVGALPKVRAESPYQRLHSELQAKMAQDPAHFGQPHWHSYDPRNPVLGEAGSADAVLTFRNVHNWVAADTADAYFKAFFEVLKPGGVLGVVDHRAKPGTELEAMKKSGYLTEELVIEYATRAGFRLDARSEVNANPKDSANHANGVWTLLPVAKHDAADAEKYRAIGESDRMTLRFVKP